MTTNTCPRCRRVFRVPDDEEGQHPCPGCGYEPGMRLDDDMECDVELTDDDDPTWVEEE
jgi:PHP family Zn ribbon phosphoesterase